MTAVDAGRAQLTLSCPALGTTIAGRVDSAPLAGALEPGAPLAAELLQGKRDGEVCFAYVDPPHGPPGPLATRGRAGDVFLFRGDPSGTGDERRAQIVIAYGDQHHFVEPLDRGFRPREYELIGSLDDPDGLQRLGGHVWRHGACAIELALEAT